MSRPPAEGSGADGRHATPGFQRLDPTTAQGQQAAKQAGVIAAGVINRLRREGIPVPGEE